MSLSAQQLLARQTTRGWLALAPEARHVVIDALLEVAPANLLLASTVGHASSPLPFFLHQPTQLGFHLVFGERFLFGVSDACQDRCRQYRADVADDEDGDWHRESAAEVLAEVARMQPAHFAEVAPFFIAESELDSSWWSRLGFSNAPSDPGLDAAMGALAGRGWRLPSEAELELNRLLRGIAPDPRDWPSIESGRCADSWHPNYVGAPGDGSGWGSASTVVRSWGSYVWGDNAPLQVSRRQSVGASSVRPAISLLPLKIARDPLALAARAALPPLTDA